MKTRKQLIEVALPARRDQPGVGAGESIGSSTRWPFQSTHVGALFIGASDPPPGFEANPPHVGVT